MMSDLTMSKRLLASGEERADFGIHRTGENKVLASMAVITDEEG
jgi:hypothetical protein